MSSISQNEETCITYQAVLFAGYFRDGNGETVRNRRVNADRRANSEDSGKYRHLRKRLRRTSDLEAVAYLRELGEQLAPVYLLPSGVDSK